MLVEGNPHAPPCTRDEHRIAVTSFARRQDYERSVAARELSSPHAWRRRWVLASRLGSMRAAIEAEDRLLSGRQTTYTERNELKALGRAPRANGRYRVSERFLRIR